MPSFHQDDPWDQLTETLNQDPEKHSVDEQNVYSPLHRPPSRITASLLSSRYGMVLNKGKRLAGSSLQLPSSVFPRNRSSRRRSRYHHSNDHDESENERHSLLDQATPLVNRDINPNHSSHPIAQQQQRPSFREQASSGLFINGPTNESVVERMVRANGSTTNNKRTNHSSSASHNHINQHQDSAIQDCGNFIFHGLFCCPCIRTQEVGIIETFGNFQRATLEPGLYCIAWPCTRMAGRLSLRVQQLDVICETKTQDNVQYRVLCNKTFDAHYRLTNPHIQIKSYVYDVVRSTVPRMELDEVFLSKSDIALSIRTSLYSFMQEYGYEILDALVIDLSPNDKIKASMNEINASKRMKEACIHKAESAKIEKVNEAQAHCESLHLSGIGIARERQAISKGLRASIRTLTSASDDIETREAMDILLVSQYFDLISDVSGDMMILEHGLNVVSHLRDFRQ